MKTPAESAERGRMLAELIRPHTDGTFGDASEAIVEVAMYAAACSTDPPTGLQHIIQRLGEALECMPPALRDAKERK